MTTQQMLDAFHGSFDSTQDRMYGRDHTFFAARAAMAEYDGEHGKGRAADESEGAFIAKGDLVSYAARGMRLATTAAITYRATAAMALPPLP